MSSRLRIVVTGLIAQHSRLGGVTWDYLQYPVGLSRLGHDVYYLEDSGQWAYNLDGGPTGNDLVAYDPAENVAHLAGTMARFGLADKWAYRFALTSEWYGMSSGERAEVFRSADLLINVSGTLEHPDRYRAVPRLAYIDSDPVFTQVKLVAGDQEFTARVDAHDVHFTFGESFSSAVPVTGHDWRPTRQPVLLSAWQPSGVHREVFTTVMSWKSYESLTHEGNRYGQKDVEFAHFLSLPQLVPAEFEVALGGATYDLQSETGHQPGEARALTPETGSSPYKQLRQGGWRVVDALEVAGDLDGYRDHIRSSMAEWSVAKHGYVAGRPGWFSCRSACYLACGRPVVVQDTGFGAVLPTGEGLLPFATLDEAIAAVEDVAGNYPVHAKAARAIAEEYFDSDAVLDRLLDEAMT